MKLIFLCALFIPIIYMAFRQKKWYLCLLFAFIGILPEQLALRIHDKLPLVTASRILILIVFLFWFIQCIKKKKFVAPVSMLAFLGVNLIVSLINLPHNFSELNRIFLFIFERAFLLIAVTSLIDNKEELDTCIDFMILGCVAVSVIAIIQALFNYDIASVMHLIKTVTSAKVPDRMGLVRAYGTTNAISLACFCAFMLLPIYLRMERTRKFYYSIAFALTVIAMICTLTRGAWLCALIVLFFLAILQWKRFFATMLPAAILTLVLCIGLCFAQPKLYTAFMETGKTVINTALSLLPTKSQEPTKPSEATTATTEPSQATTVVTEPVETTTAASEPVESTTAATEPVETTTAATEPVETTTAATEPVETTTAATEPVETTTAATEPVETTEPIDTTVPADSVTITVQPESVNVPEGLTAEVTFTAVGKDLTYEWYFKDTNADAFKLTKTFTGPTYTTTMNATRNGRQIYCVVTDQYGIQVKTDTVTLTRKSVPLEIVEQPVSVTSAANKKATVQVTAIGDDLTYRWYYASKNSNDFKLTESFTSNVYSIPMTPSRAGRQVYCVITDKTGSSVQSNTVVLNMDPNSSNNIFEIDDSFGPNQDNALNSRNMQWSAVEYMAKEGNLLFGYGYNAYLDGKLHYRIEYEGQTWWQEAHAIDVGLVSLFTESGLVGFLSLFALLGYMLVVAWIRRDRTGNLDFYKMTLLIIPLFVLLNIMSSFLYRPTVWLYFTLFYACHKLEGYPCDLCIRLPKK